MLRKLLFATLLFGQIVLFAAAAGNVKTADDPLPPPCNPCTTANN
jgi:hypothetical protein